MPSTRIETRSGWISTHRAEVIEAVHSALIDAIAIPAHDRDIKIIEYDHDMMAVPLGATSFYTVIEISMFLGRSEEAKRDLFQRLVERMSVFGHAATDLSVILHEIPRYNWGLNGVPASSLELSYRIDV